MAIVPGQRFGNFEIVRLIGEGSFGEVYEAANPLIDRRVAIKVLHSGLTDDAEVVRRFQNEARAASGIHHPNIVEVFDAGVTPEHEPYLVMEYLEGEPLHKVIANQEKLSLPLVHEIARQTCSALAAAHAAGIVHRDLKPENLFVLHKPTWPLGIQLKVLDFGIAKIKHNNGRNPTMKTRTGLIMGSPLYMSPEQCKDSSDVDLRTDIYALGVIVYEMLAGTPPFFCESAADLLVMQLSFQPSALRLRLPDLPDHVNEAVMRALAKERSARYGSIDEFFSALLGEGSPADRTRARDPRPGSAAKDTATLHGFPGPVSAAPSPIAAPSPSAAPSLIAPPTEEDADPDPEPGERPSRERSRPWGLVAGGGAALVLLAAVLGLLLVKRSTATPAARVTTRPPAAEASAAPRPALTAIRLRIQSVPPGATVLDRHDDSTLGTTPLEKLVPRSRDALGVTLRLAGYQDEAVNLGMDADASALIHLRAVPVAPATEPSAGPKPAPVRRPAKPAARTFENWVAH